MIRRDLYHLSSVALLVRLLRRQNEKLTSDLAKTRMALDIMGKHMLLAELSESTDNDRPPRTS
ncbi:hypothetical protein ALI22I_01420 [Saccharothrix sp. ALI-22-I]|nr:hypothetical protein ALI22I_01420 [Saccharothrix sp. ALI-22-I]